MTKAFCIYLSGATTVKSLSDEPAGQLEIRFADKRRYSEAVGRAAASEYRPSPHSIVSADDYRKIRCRFGGRSSRLPGPRLIDSTRRVIEVSFSLPLFPLFNFFL
jgi:hypothetical protein